MEAQGALRANLYASDSAVAEKFVTLLINASAWQKMAKEAYYVIVNYNDSIVCDDFIMNIGLSLCYDLQQGSLDPDTINWLI